MPSSNPAAAPARGRHDRFWILGAICLAGLVLPLSFTAPPVAIPAIAAELGGTPVALNWMTNAFMLAFGSCLMAAGTLADTYGRKRVFATGIVAFAAVSLLLALAPSLAALNALRVLQGVAAALALAGGNAALSQEFHGPARIRAFSLLGTAFGLGLAFGPSLAGWLVQAQGWRSVFLSSLAIAVLATVFGLPRMRESRDPDAGGLDWRGSLSSTAMLALLTIGVLEAPERGWGDPWVLGALVGSAALLVWFVRIENRAERPMLDLSLLRYPRFVGAQLLPIGTGLCYLALIVLLPVRLIGIHGLGTLDAGLMMIALSAPMLVVPMLAAVLNHRVGASTLCAAGLLLAAAGLAWLGWAAGRGEVAGLVAPMLLIGTGSAIPWGLMDGLAISVVPKERAGMAAGVFGASRVSGEGIALAIVAAALAGLLQWRLGQGGAAAGEALNQAAQRLATGDAVRAQALLPQFAPAALRAAYDSAFAWLMNALAGATAVVAWVVYALLGPVAEPAAQMAASAEALCEDGAR
ncbi:MFS transporter [Lysobacter enzymogenes]|uniref:MFS transporter n=1 Tax=Lysobacter enzymogenes TaxID=69 RepID=UPI00099D3961|nr:MFS transporter [Lysobacter enzymogenes]UZW60687.1 MFS transporter [Lysobacter enzymogenes]